MRVLVTGSTGFLGPYLIRELGLRGHAVRALVRPGRDPHRARAAGAGTSEVAERDTEMGAAERDAGREVAEGDSTIEVAEGDLADEAGLRRALRGCDALVHAAALRTTRRDEFELQRKTNVEGTSRLLRAAQAAGIARIVHVSSMAGVGFAREAAPLSESARWNVGELGVEHFDTKKESEERALAGAWAGMDLCVVNPGTLLGPRAQGGAHELVEALRAGRVRSSPVGGASVVDVADAAHGCVLALERGRRGERYLLGGTNVTWNALDAELARELGIAAPSANAGMLARWRTPPEHDAFRPSNAWSWIDDAKARAELGYVSRPLSETVQRAVSAAPAPRA